MFYRTSVLVGALVAAAVTCSSAYAQQERIVKLGIELPETHPHGQGVVKFAELLDKKSGGKLKVKPYYSGALGDALKMVSALKGGVQEATMPATAALAGDIKDFGLFDLPFLFNNEKEADFVLDGPAGSNMLAKLPSKGLVGLCYWEIGFRHMTNNRKPIANMDDIRGLKIRVIQNPAYLEFFRSLGANPVPMAFTEVYTALESRTIDAQENVLITVDQSKFYEVQKYLTLTKHTYTPIVMLVSKIFWDKLEPKEQGYMREACVESRDFERKVNRETTAKILDSLKKTGMQVNEMSPIEVDRMRQIAKPVFDKYSKDFGEASYKELAAELAKVRGSN